MKRGPCEAGSPLKKSGLPLLTVRGRQVLLLHGPHAVLIGPVRSGLVAGRPDLCGILMAHVGGGVDRRRTESKCTGTDGDEKEQRHVILLSTVPTSNAGGRRGCLRRTWQKGVCHATATQPAWLTGVWAAFVLPDRGPPGPLMLFWSAEG